MQECDRFLAILCEVFDLDYDLAHGVFFADPGFDPARKWALFIEGEMQTILTTTPLQFGSSHAIGIAGVATLPAARGKGYAERLVSEVCSVSEAQGVSEAILFAKRRGLYEKCGFEVVDELVRGPIATLPTDTVGPALSFSEVEQLYADWSHQDSRRLRRDSHSWAKWKYSLKVCEPMGGGYACLEGTMIREAMTTDQALSWPVPPGAEWYGLRTLTDRIGVPGDLKFADLYLMGRGCPSPPQMFMTDQF